MHGIIHSFYRLGEGSSLYLLDTRMSPSWKGSLEADKAVIQSRIHLSSQQASDSQKSSASKARHRIIQAQDFGPYPFMVFLDSYILFMKRRVCCCQVASAVSDSVQLHRRQPTRLPCPWDSPGKNTGVGCHCLF